MLARNFADPDVGCVTGEARYTAGNRAAADVGERMYWGYEIQVKRMETALGSMVGGDGAIYAIRKSLWSTLPEDAINDFLNPLQIVGAGWRNVYEPDAVCYEETAGAFRSEYKRRVRIVSRSWRAVFQARQVLNPFRAGLFTWSVISHKMLRWFSGMFVTLVASSGIVLAAKRIVDSPAASLALTVVAILLVALFADIRRIFGMVGYFAVINAASLVGIAKGTAGRVSGVWASPRQPGDAATHTWLVPVGRLLLLGGLLSVAAIFVAYASELVRGRLVALLFWTCAALLAYIYIGYPALLAAARLFANRPVRRGTARPTVCLFITANDEAEIIAAKLENSLATDYPPELLDIVVADDGSVDGTARIASRFSPRVRVLPFSPRRGKIAAINAGMTAVGSDIVVFSDANTFLSPDAITALVRNFADPAVGGVSGDVTLVGDRAALARSEDLYYVYERWVQQAESDIGSMIGADGALYAIRRELFVPPAADTILDDMAIPMSVVRAGRRVVFEPTARASERGSESAREEFARKARVIAGAIQFLRRDDSAIPLNKPQVIFSMVSHKGLRWLSPVFATCVFLTSIALANASHAYAAAAAAQGILIAFGFAGCIPALRRFSIVAIPHYFFLVQAAAIVGFVRGMTGRQSVLWQRFVHGSSGATEPAGAVQ
jgi:cellulose synthase/poly-beta-1,6-N-acetylglucosamine synthase-like glycosyltransferase